MTEGRQSLWRHADFLKLWAAQSISLFGTEITGLAVPLTAVLLLNASAWQMGVLRASGEAPFLLLSLFAGVWIDRVRRRPVLLGADIVRALLLLSIPAAAWWNVLTLPQLYLVTFGVGSLSVVFDVAHYAYVPAMLPRAQLVDANSKLQTSYSVAESGGPAVAGVLTQALSAPFAVLADALSYILSAGLLRAITTSESEPAKPSGDVAIRDSIREGLRALLAPLLLRVIVGASAIISGFESALLALYVLYATQELHLGPADLGLVFALGGVAAVGGAILAGRAAKRWGVGPAIVGGWLLAALARLLIPAANGPATMEVLIAAQIVAGSAGAIANIHQWTFRQAVTPDELLGRVTASHRFIVYGASAIGALLGGVLGEWLGLRAALSICALGAVMGAAIALASPLRQLREQPTAPVVG